MVENALKFSYDFNWKSLYDILTIDAIEKHRICVYIGFYRR